MSRPSSVVAIPPEAQSLFHVMATMRAMRRLKADPVPDALLEQLVEAATWAPSGRNAQAYEFIVVTDRAQMMKLAQLWRRCVDIYMAILGRSAPARMDDAAAGRRRQAIAYQRDHFHETPAVIVACYAYPRHVDREMLRGMASLGPVGLTARRSPITPVRAIGRGRQRLPRNPKPSACCPGLGPRSKHHHLAFVP